MLEKIREAADFLLEKIPFPPRIGLITGTGLGDLTKNMEVHLRIPYPEIPHFPVSTTVGHKGTLVIRPPWQTGRHGHGREISSL